MSFRDILTHLYVPLLTQETAIMISTFTYGLKAGESWFVLVLVNTLAVMSDLALFFVPTYFLADWLHGAITKRFEYRYRQGGRIVERLGAFRTATALAFVMPSIGAMLVVGALRLSFWRALSGLFLGSALYVVIPLAIALPLAPIVPKFLLPVLPWLAPAIAVLLLSWTLLKSNWNSRRTRVVQGSSPDPDAPHAG